MQWESKSDQLRGAKHNRTEIIKNSDNHLDGCSMAFLVCCVLFFIFLPEIYSIHRSLHITFNSIRLHDHQLPKKKQQKYFLLIFLFLLSKRASKRQKKIIKEAMHAFYFILCAERTSDQDENSVFFFVVKPAFFCSSLFLFHSLFTVNAMYELS